MAASLEVGPGSASPTGRNVEDVPDAWIDQNIVVAMAQRKTTKKQPRGVMTLDEVRAAIAAAAEFDPAVALALRIAAMTGARRAELAALRWDDVDEDGVLTIDSAIEVIRRPGAPRELRDAPTKTGKARTMTLDPDTLNAIWELRRQREPYGPWMFGVGPELVPPGHIGWWWTRARKNSSIDMKWRLHDLRHWSATDSIGQGHDVRTVAGRFGHSKPSDDIACVRACLRRRSGAGGWPRRHAASR